MTASLCNAALFHEDHFITVNKILGKVAIRQVFITTFKNQTLPHNPSQQHADTGKQHTYSHITDS